MALFLIGAPLVAGGAETGGPLDDHVIPLTAVAPGAAGDDLAPLVETIGDARVVGIGMAAPGARECFTLGHRLIERLVEERGFTVVALATSLPDCQTLNEYVLYGTGDAEEALHAQGYWTWDNGEVLDVVRWMRRYNEDPQRGRTVQLWGIDMHNAGPALDRVMSFLHTRGYDGADADAARLERLRGFEIFRRYPGLSDEKRADLTTAAAQLVDAVDRIGSEDDASRDARRQATVVQQNEAWVRGHFVNRDRQSVSSLRDRALAANLVSGLDAEDPRTKVVVWAHNANVSRVVIGDAPAAETTLGRELADRFGDDYRAVAVTFNRGSVRAIHVPIEWPEDYVQTLEAHRVEAARPDQVEAVLADLGPRLAIDLRAAAADELARQWLAEPRSMWFMGSGYSPERAERGAYRAEAVLSRSFDALIFIESVTPANPNRRTRERFDAQGK